MHQRSRLTVAILLATLGLVAGAPLASAEAPMDLSPGVRVLDTTNTLGSTSALQSDIDKLASDRSVNLFVVTIDKFESPSDSTSWTKKLASTNNFGSNDAVLVIATEDRQAKFMVGSTDTLSTKQQEAIYNDYIYPKLKSSDYNGAAEAAVEGINSKLSGGGASGVLTGGATLAGVAAVAAGGAWLFGRGRRKQQPSSAGSASIPQGNSQPLTPLPQLHKDASSILIKLDDAIAHADQELQFAQLQYGDAEAQKFATALEEAKNHRSRSFQLQKQLDDDIPDTEEDQRSWLNEIINRSNEALTLLDQQEKSFSELRQLESNLPQALASAHEQNTALEQLIPQAEQVLSRVSAKYAESAVTPFADNISEAKSRQDFAQDSLAEAEKLKDSNRSQAILNLRAGEEALGQAQGLLDTVVKSESELDKAQESLQAAILLAERDIAQAQEYSKYGSTAQLSGAAAGVTAVLASIKEQANSPKPDPLALTEQLRAVREDLDKALGTVRQTQEQDAAALETLKHTLVSAQAAVSTANDYVWSRRGGIQSSARTSLREAERHLSEAQQLQFTQPSIALSHANDAIRLATQAQHAAQQDVDSYTTSRSSYGGGNSMNSAMLGGILLGSLFGSSHGGGMFGGGSSSGNFGGGGFGGGSFGGGGDWGGGDGAGGNF